MIAMGIVKIIVKSDHGASCIADMQAKDKPANVKTKITTQQSLQSHQ